MKSESIAFSSIEDINLGKIKIIERFLERHFSVCEWRYIMGEISEEKASFSCKENKHYAQYLRVLTRNPNEFVHTNIGYINHPIFKCWDALETAGIQHSNIIIEKIYKEENFY